MKECDKVKRKTRIRTEWIPRENNFICSDCNSKGGCGDNKQNAIKNKLPFFWDERYKKIVCLCGHWLESKEELEEQVDIKEIQQYGFWLRFMSEHFIPCDKCQERLNNVLTLQTKMMLDFDNPCCITLRAYKCEQNSLPEFTFILSFVSPTTTTSYRFHVCDDCQGKLWHLFSKKELHIGNDTKPLVELWRKWEIIDDDTEGLKQIANIVDKLPQ